MKVDQAGKKKDSRKKYFLGNMHFRESFLRRQNTEEGPIRKDHIYQVTTTATISPAVVGRLATGVNVQL